VKEATAAFIAAAVALSDPYPELTVALTAFVNNYVDYATKIEAFNAAHVLSALGYTVISSADEKDNIESLVCDATGLISRMRVVTFRYKKGGSAHIGLIAEESPAEVLGPDGKTIMLENLVGILIKANQELAARVAKVEGDLLGVRRRVARFLRPGEIV
jgi:hypothetical protein